MTNKQKTYHRDGSLNWGLNQKLDFFILFCETAAEWSAVLFNSQGQEAQLQTKEKKKLIMSNLLYLMTKDNYFFIPFTKAEYIPSDVAT